jgi:cysteine synthase
MSPPILLVVQSPRNGCRRHDGAAARSSKTRGPIAGNAAGALAAYAAQAGMEAHIFMPRDVPPANRQECELTGARRKPDRWSDHRLRPDCG